MIHRSVIYFRLIFAYEIWHYLKPPFWHINIQLLKIIENVAFSLPNWFCILSKISCSCIYGLTCFIGQYVYANSTLYWLFQVYIKSCSQEVLDLQVRFLFLYFFHFYMNFRINLPISTKQSARILTWSALNLLPNLGENWYLNNIQASDSWTRYVAPFI